MTAHLSAKPGDIAETVLMPGDPLRAKWIAETFLDDATCYSSVRNMFGFTGTYKGERISVQGSGMGMPSASIYTHELLAEYGVKTLVRIGSGGAITERLGLMDVVAGIGAASESNMNRLRFGGNIDYAPVADFGLLRNAVDAAADRGVNLEVGQILSGDVFYHDHWDIYEKLAEYGVLCVEMEAAAMYTLAAKFNARALALITISDQLITKEHLDSDQRQQSLTDMVEIALDTVTR
ncbi:purine-nucleoside phosphorylase [Natronoglycomyces albus]|uniref:Uridine phosphorylase n=1 Tax=Natronoglycomyces albus TaxID=2811108 RepID=A0A895XJR1_9ACTN|nr:purine-nucleoside phosphorylase [Natronoglycomyces albus]QSB05574.1 purine-nucleoside phosphorylase [Natronoglycomyces albus]